MRLRKRMVEHVAKTVAGALLTKDLVDLDIPEETLVAELRRVITEDLMVEDRLNDEVKEILRAHTAAMDRGNIDYARMFTMVKKQLARERGLIL